MATLYPWYAAPSWAIAAATDRNGCSAWYSKKPEYHKNNGFWFCTGEYKTVIIHPNPNIKIYWLNSLELKENIK